VLHYTKHESLVNYKHSNLLVLFVRYKEEEVFMNTTPDATNLHFSLSLMLRVTKLGNFSPIELLLEADCDLKKEIAQRNGNILGFFLLKQIY
jgi:hypothetical protein